MREQLQRVLGSQARVLASACCCSRAPTPGAMEELGYGVPTRVTYENTYITEPEGYGPGTRFERHKVKEVLDEMLTARLQNQQYDPVKSSQISKMLADDLREKVRHRRSRASGGLAYPSTPANLNSCPPGARRRDGFIALLCHLASSGALRGAAVAVRSLRRHSATPCSVLPQRASTASV